MHFGRAPVGGVHDHSPFKKAARPDSPPVTILPSGLRNANQSQYHPRRSKTQRVPPFRAGPQTTPTGSEAVEKAEPRGTSQIGRAHVRTPVTNAHIVCRLLLQKK